MSRRRRVSAAVRRQLAEAADHACSYCRSPAVAGVPLAVDHIIPVAAGGTNRRENLCTACYRCNEFKGVRTVAVDPLTAEATPLFHPNNQRWPDHFAWSQDGLTIVGLTPTGRSTIDALRMNNDWLVRARGIWILAGIHPPLDAS